MVLPGNVNTITVTGTYMDMSGTPLVGTVTFRPAPEIIRDPDANVLITDYPFTVMLDVNGSFEIDLPATDDPDLIPTPWYYVVSENMNDHRRQWFLEVPLSSPGGTLDLADVDRAQRVPAVITYASRTDLLSHIADATDVHGIANTADLETKNGALTKANTAQSNAIASAAASLAQHRSRLPYNVKDFAAVGDGVADDRAAIQAAIDAAAAVTVLANNGGEVILPKGEYNIGATPLVLKSGIKIRGAGSAGTILKGTAGLFTWSGTCALMEIEDIWLSASGGHLIVNTGTGSFYENRFNRVRFFQASNGFSIFQLDGAPDYIDNMVENCELNGPAGRTVPMWNLRNTTASSHNRNTWRNLRINSANATGAPVFSIRCAVAANWSYDNRFEDINFEQVLGGGIHAYSVNGLEIKNCSFWDPGANYGVDLVKIDTDATSGVPSKNYLINNVERRGGNVNGGVYDINVGTCHRGIVMNCEHAASPLSMNLAQQTILMNSGTDGIGFGGTAARWYRGNTSSKIATNAHISIDTLGAGLYIKEGTNGRQGVVTLAGGTAVVSTNQVGANSRIQLTVQSLGTVTVPKAVGITARTPGVSFTITSADPTDTSVVAYVINEPA